MKKQKKKTKRNETKRKKHPKLLHKSKAMRKKMKFLNKSKSNDTLHSLTPLHEAKDGRRTSGISAQLLSATELKRTLNFFLLSLARGFPFRSYLLRCCTPNILYVLHFLISMNSRVNSDDCSVFGLVQTTNEKIDANQLFKRL